MTRTIIEAADWDAAEQHIHATFNIHLEYEGIVLPVEKDREKVIACYPVN